MYVAATTRVALAVYLDLFHLFVYFFQFYFVFVLGYYTILCIILYNYSLDASFISKERKTCYRSGCGGGRRELGKVGRENL